MCRSEQIDRRVRFKLIDKLDKVRIWIVLFIKFDSF
jgi:hypothetical protein